MVNKPSPAIDSGHPSLRGTGGNGDRVFESLTLVVASFIVVLLSFIIIMLVIDARQSIATFGLDFLTQTEWNPVFSEFGALAFIYGTLATSFIALLLAVPVAVGAALFVAEYAPPWLRTPFAFTTDLLAAIPSIIYGLWAFFVISPIMRETIEPALRDTIGQAPVIGILFSGQIIGKDLLTAGVILAIMILPIITAISREIILQVPPTQREGMLALGATKWETVRLAVLPYARLGITGAAILGLARALGETMAVTMVIGNSSTEITGSLFTPGYTLASAIANQFNEADTPIYFSAIVQVALVLLLVSAIVNVLARLLVWVFSRRVPGQLRA